MANDYNSTYMGYMCGEIVPIVKDITEGFSLFPEAIYINRHLSEYAAYWYGFAPSSQPFSFEERIRSLDVATLDHLQATHSDGFIEVENGTIVTEYRAPGMDPTTTHCTHSVGKSWTSATWSDALLPLADSPVTDFLPALEGTLWEGVNIRYLLDMQVPVKWWEDYTDPNSPVVLSGSACGFDVRQGPTAGLVDFVLTLERDSELNLGDWHYASINTLILAKLGSTITGKSSYERLFDFYQAMGLEHRCGIVANAQGEIGADGGHAFTLRDQVKLPWAMANGGRMGEREVLSQDYIDDVFTDIPVYRKAWDQGDYSAALPGVSYYRNKWFVIDKNIAMGVGSYGQFILFNRANCKAIAKFSTYKHGQDFGTASVDIPWLIERIQQ